MITKYIGVYLLMAFRKIFQTHFNSNSDLKIDKRGKTTKT